MPVDAIADRVPVAAFRGEPARAAHHVDDVAREGGVEPELEEHGEVGEGDEDVPEPQLVVGQIEHEKRQEDEAARHGENRPDVVPDYIGLAGFNARHEERHCLSYAQHPVLQRAWTALSLRGDMYKSSAPSGKEEVVALEANAKRFRETIYGHKHNAEKQRIPSFPAKHPQEQQPIPSDKGKGGQDPKSQNQMAPCIIHNKRVRLPILPINRGISGKIAAQQRQWLH